MFENSTKSLAKLAFTSVLSIAGIFTSPDIAAAHDVAKEMTDNANTFLASLDDEQKASVQFEFQDEMRKNWHFIPMERKGLGLKQMKPHQRGLAMAMVQTALSHRGYATTMQVMALEQVLHELENGNMRRDPAKYHVFIFGEPSTDSNWGWKIEGHHLSISVTLAGGKKIVVAPSFLGANPAEVRSGSMQGLRTLGDIEDLGRKLIKQLSIEQKKIALLDGEVPKDIINGPKRKSSLLDPPGLPAREMTESQKQSLQKLVDSYLGRFRVELADGDRKEIQAAGFENLHFAWSGEIQPGKPHYFRVQGPTFVFEYDNTQNGANHVHVVWRSLKNDFGADALLKHYESSHGATPQPVESKSKRP